MKNIKIKFNSLTLYFLLIALLSGYIKNALIVLFIILFHEFGHIMMALLLGYKVLSVEIFPFGGLTKIDKLLNTKIYKDLLIATAGILFQLFIYLFCQIRGLTGDLISNYNLSIMLFNLFPIIPLDGSKIVFELLNYHLSYQKSLVIYSVISIIFIVIYFALNYHYELNNYMIIALFVTKTIEEVKQRKVIHNKFILERFLYNPEFSKIKNSNQPLNKYQKDTKYYYNINNKVIAEKDYLTQVYHKWYNWQSPVILVIL